MSMIGFGVQVPVNAITPLASSPTPLTGRCTIAVVGAATVYVLPSPSKAPSSAAIIVSDGYPVTIGAPLVIDDPAGAPLPDLASYYATTTGLIDGDVRVIS